MGRNIYQNCIVNVNAYKHPGIELVKEDAERPFFEFDERIFAKFKSEHKRREIKKINKKINPNKFAGIRIVTKEGPLKGQLEAFARRYIEKGEKIPFTGRVCLRSDAYPDYELNLDEPSMCQKWIGQNKGVVSITSVCRIVC